MKKLGAILLVAAMLGGCASVTKIEGDQLVKSRLAVKVSDAWNKVSIPGNEQPYDAWTQEGLALDHLRFWAAIKPGQALMTTPPGSIPSGQKAPQVPTFAAGMPVDKLVNLFETLYSADGSLVSVSRVQPTSFAGEAGVRFEFTVVRKRDDVQLQGIGWLCVRKDELFAATFVAPKLAFYPRLLPKAEEVIRTAQIKS